VVGSRRDFFLELMLIYTPGLFTTLAKAEGLSSYHISKGRVLGRLEIYGLPGA
jgi:hypothetical protein